MILAATALLLGISGAASLPGCVRVVRSVPAGRSIITTDLGAAVACPVEYGASAAGVDRKTSMLRARRDLVEGDIIAAQPSGILPAVRKGDTLILRSRVGAIAVERPVTALQPARAGRRIFVTTGDGQVVPVRVDEGLP